MWMMYITCNYVVQGLCVDIKCFILILCYIHRHLLKSTVILLPLLGFTWIIGLFAVGEEGRVFAYLFVIANVFQVREECSTTTIPFHISEIDTAF